MVPQLPAQQFQAWCASQTDRLPVLLDVREAWEVESASVRAQGFELQWIAMGEIVQRLDELPRDRPIACLCHHGMRSMQVARFLQQQGFDTVVNLQGGIDAWSSSVDPTVPRY
jgi:rhodanese-related sulfurtransferase